MRDAIAKKKNRWVEGGRFVGLRCAGAGLNRVRKKPQGSDPVALRYRGRTKVRRLHGRLFPEADQVLRGLGPIGKSKLEAGAVQASRDDLPTF